MGSPNVSKTSQGLSEACIETTDLGLINDAKSYVKELCGDLITAEFAKSLIPAVSRLKCKNCCMMLPKIKCLGGEQLGRTFEP